MDKFYPKHSNLWLIFDQTRVQRNTSWSVLQKVMNKMRKFRYSLLNKKHDTLKFHKSNNFHSKGAWLEFSRVDKFPVLYLPFNRTILVNKLENLTSLVIIFSSACACMMQPFSDQILPKTTSPHYQNMIIEKCRYVDLQIFVHRKHYLT